MEKMNFKVSEQTADWANLYRELYDLQERIHKQLEVLFVEPDSEFEEHFMNGFLSLFNGVQHMIGESVVDRLGVIENINAEETEI